jgi:hypothetical protein
MQAAGMAAAELTSVAVGLIISRAAVCPTYSIAVEAVTSVREEDGVEEDIIITTTSERTEITPTMRRLLHRRYRQFIVTIRPVIGGSRHRHILPIPVHHPAGSPPASNSPASLRLITF